MRSSRLIASYVALGLGCGRAGNTPPDGQPADAGDASDARSTGMVYVRAYSERWPGTPEAGARVLVARPGEPIAETTTGTDGVAEVEAVAGTTVTVVQPAYLPRGTVGEAFATFVDVAPGMSIVVGPRRPRATVASTVRFAMAAYPGGRFYSVETPCESHGAGEGTVGTLTIHAPCTTISAATVVGVARDDLMRVLAVAVLDDVDLLAADGTTITMPPFDVEPTLISADILHVLPDTAGPFPTVNYRRGADTEHLLNMGTMRIVATDAASTRLELAGYPVGDSTSLDVVFPHRDADGAFARSDFHLHQSGAVHAFTLDAGAMIRSVFEHPTTTVAGVTWRERPVGEAAEVVAAALAWNDVRGVIVAPYTGTSLSFDVLPPELRPPEAPVLWELHTWKVDGLPYRDVVPRLEQSRDFRMWTLEVPRDSNWWRSSFVKPGLWPTPSVLTPGMHDFSWDEDEDRYFRFASGEWIAQEHQGPVDGWRDDLDAFGHLTLPAGGLNTHYHNTTQSVDGMVRMRFDIEDVTGTVDLANETASWQLAGAVAFNIPGVVGETSCKTAPFTVTFRGNWRTGSYSEPFAVPSLTGVGTQACAGRAAEINTKFALGRSGALLNFFKFRVVRIPAPELQ